MPPAPVKIERIAGDRTRQNTFHKRKLGLIKKAIELTVLCDCDIAIIVKSGPTIMCPEGKMSAYCNKDLEAMISQYMEEPPQEQYSNDEYSRLSKGDISLPPSRTSSAATTLGASMPAFEVDVAAGTHKLVSSEDEEEKLKLRLESMEAELQKLRDVVASGTSAIEITSAVQSCIAEHTPAAEQNYQEVAPAPGVEEACATEGWEQALVGKKRPAVPLDVSCEALSQRGTPERESKRTCVESDEAPAWLAQLGVGREVSWDLGGFFGAGAVTADPLASPFHLANTPIAAAGCPLRC